MTTYGLECPGCGEEFDIDLEPAQLGDDGDLIECPNCFNEWEWGYDADAGTLELLPDEDEDEDGDMPLVDDEDEDDDEDNEVDGELDNR